MCRCVGVITREVAPRQCALDFPGVTVVTRTVAPCGVTSQWPAPASLLLVGEPPFLLFLPPPKRHFLSFPKTLS